MIRKCHLPPAWEAFEEDDIVTINAQASHDIDVLK